MGKGVVKLGEGDWAVKDGNLLAAKETNGRFKNAEFTVTRGTDATYLGKDGLIKTANFYNIMSHSERTTANNMAVLSGTLSNSTVSSPSLISQVLRFQPTFVDQPRIEIGSMSFNQAYTVSCFVKKGLGDYFGLGLYNSSFSPNANTWVRFNINTGQHDGTEDSNNISNVNIDSIGDGWYRISASITTGSIASQSGIKFTAMSSYSFARTDSTDNYYYISGLQIELGSNLSPYQYTNGKEGIPRIDFADNTDGHLLLEPESRNLIPYSEDFSSSNWSHLVSASIDPNVVVSPDGTQNASRLNFHQGSTTSRIEKQIVGQTTGSYTFSVWAKSATNENVQFEMEIGSAGTGTVAKTATSDWQRFKVTGSVSSGTVNLYPQIESYTSTNPSIYIWGAQFEKLSYPTSYIPTNGGTVTRDAETCINSGEAADFNSEEGVLYAEIAALSEEDKTAGSQIAISDGTTNKRIIIFSSSAIGTEGDIKVAIVKSSTESEERIALDNSSATDLASFNKIAIGYKPGENVLFVNGSKITGANTDFETFTFDFSSALNNLEFSDGSGNNPFRGKCKAIRVYKEALNDTDLGTLTSQ